MSINDEIDDALNECKKLCHGKKWCMTIPVKSTDSDYIIHKALWNAKQEINKLKLKIEQLEIEMLK